MNIILKNCKYLDVDNGKYSSKCDILIKDNYIFDIVKNYKTNRINKNIITIDMSGLYILPGLIDTHVHMSYTMPEEDKDMGIKLNKKLTLDAGFTTVRDLAGPIFNFNRFEHTPRILYSYIPLTFNELKSKKIIDETLKDRLNNKVDAIKIFISKNKLPSLENLKYTVNKSDVPIAIHAMYPEEIHLASLSGCRSIEHCYYINKDNYNFNNETYICPTFSNPSNYLDNFNKYIHIFKDNPERHKRFFEDIIDVNLKNISSIYPKANIVFGTDAVAGFHGKNLNEFNYLCKFMSPIEAIRTATSIAADMLYFEDIGRIEVNKIADIIAMKNDPLKNINNLQDFKLIIRDGIIFKNNIS